MLFNFLIAGSTHAVQHVLNAIGYESSKSAGGKPGDQGPVAMEMEPEDVQWLKVRMDLPCSLLHSHLSPFPSFLSACFFPFLPPDSSISFSSLFFPCLYSFSSLLCICPSHFYSISASSSFLWIPLSSPCPLSTNYMQLVSFPGSPTCKGKLCGASEQGPLNVIKSLIPRLAWSLGMRLVHWPCED